MIDTETRISRLILLSWLITTSCRSIGIVLSGGGSLLLLSSCSSGLGLHCTMLSQLFLHGSQHSLSYLFWKLVKNLRVDIVCSQE